MSPLADAFPAGSLRPDPAAAPPLHRVLAQARFETRVQLANGEQLLLTMVLPTIALVLLTRLSVPDLGTARRVDVIAPGVLALAVMSTAFTGQAIATGFDRRYGVLRLLGTTPLGKAGLLAGRVLAVLAVQALQVLVLGTVAAVLGWEPIGRGVPAAVLGIALGTAAFVALGLLLASVMRAEATLAAANLIWVLLLVGGGVVVPSGVIQVLPSAALGNALRSALEYGRLDWGALAVLVAWSGLAGVAAIRWFRWD